MGPHRGAIGPGPLVRGQAIGMRLVNLHIVGFGVFRDATVADLAPGISVFEAPNEAGKTTLLAFIRTMLFGFERRGTVGNRYEPAQGDRHGGSVLAVMDDGRRIRIERYEGGTRGRLAIYDDDGRRCDERVLEEALHRTPKSLYENVFAFGLSELERLDSLQADELGQYLYTASIEGGAYPLADARDAIREERDTLFTAGSRKSVILSLSHRLEDTQRAIRELQQLGDDSFSIRERLASVTGEVAQLQRQEEDTRRDVKWLETILQLWESWEELRQIRGALQTLPRVETFPEGGLERLEQIERAVGGLDGRIQATETAIREADERRRDLKLDERLLASQTEILALTDLHPHYRSVLDSLPDLRARRVERRKVLDQALARLGPDWNDARLVRFEASIAIREQIRAYRERIQGCKQQVAEATRRQEEVDRARMEKEGQADRLQQGLESLTLSDAPDRAPLEEREQALRQWIHLSHQRELAQQQERYLKDLQGTLADQIKALQGDLAALEGETGLPIWLIAAVGVVFAGMVVWFGLNEQWEIASVLVLAGTLTCGLLTWKRSRLEQERLTRLDEATLQHHALSKRARGLQQEASKTEAEVRGFEDKMAACRRLAGLAESPSLEQVDEASRQLDAEKRVFERRKDLEARVQDAEESLVKILEDRQASDKALRVAEEALDAVLEEWNGFVKKLELPAVLTPDGALEVLASVERAKVEFGEWEAGVLEMERLENQAQEQAHRINATLEGCGWQPVERPETPGALLSVKKALDETLRAKLELDRVLERRAEKEAELDALRNERSLALRQREELLASGLAKDTAEFRERAEQRQRRDRMEQRQRELEVALKSQAGSGAGWAALEQTLTSKSRVEVERQLAQLRLDELPRLSSALAQQLQDKSRWEQQLYSMEQSERLSALLLEEQALLAKLGEVADRWAQRALALHLIEQARQVYERERQPAVLRQASEYFRAMTGGRWVRILVPHGEMRIEVESPEGVRRSTSQLSRATAEQLYLAIRLAFIREHARQAGPLPILLDDILVNFDPARARLTIEVLQDLAASHQILVFTAHASVRRWFEEVIENVTVRPLPENA